ncbi:MAG: PhzF family phenazine biosynthesis protein [Deltaproteobacteria bacterium]|nr:PhzF family phenazine biosynthesis protein [Deltaproteobacteria bacterium]
MDITFFQVDAFASRVFSGNPAGVCLLASWLPDEVLQSLAAENNLSETAFLVERDRGYDLRWFTPKVRALHGASRPVQCRLGKNATPPQQAELAGARVLPSLTNYKLFESCNLAGHPWPASAIACRNHVSQPFLT